jgi:hypothetical protein
MPEVVYVSGALLSALCAVLLLRAWARSRHRLLLWSGLCFVGLSINNGLLLVDRVVLPDADLSTVRLVPAVVGLALLLWGLLWEVE